MTRTILLLFLLLAGCTNERPASITAPADASSTPREVTEHDFESKKLKFVQLSSQNFGKSIRVSGYIDVPAEGRATVSPYYGGYVKDIHLVPGQKVNKSETLLILEHPDFLNVQRDYIQVKEELVYLKDDFERQKILLEENINSRKSFLKAESDYKQAQARYAALREQLVLMGLSITRIEQGIFSTEIKLTSPIDGYITGVHAVKGQFLPAASQAVAIINTEHLHLELRVFEKDIALIKENQTIRIKLPRTDTYAYGKVYMIGKEISGEERAALVHAHLTESASLKLNPGLFLETDIFLEDRWAQGLPTNAIQSNTIWITKSQSWPLVLEQFPVETGEITGEYTEIVGELGKDIRIVAGI